MTEESYLDDVRFSLWSRPRKQVTHIRVWTFSLMINPDTVYLFFLFSFLFLFLPSYHPKFSHVKSSNKLSFGQWRLATAVSLVALTQ